MLLPSPIWTMRLFPNLGQSVCTCPVKVNVIKQSFSVWQQHSGTLRHSLHTAPAAARTGLTLACALRVCQKGGCTQAGNEGCFHTLLSHTPLTRSFHTLLSHAPFTHSSHTLLSHTPLTRSFHMLLNAEVVCISSH